MYAVAGMFTVSKVLQRSHERGHYTGREGGNPALVTFICTKESELVYNGFCFLTGQIDSLKFNCVLYHDDQVLYSSPPIERCSNYSEMTPALRAFLPPFY